jgi:hypothetical protein
VIGLLYAPSGWAQPAPQLETIQTIRETLQAQGVDLTGSCGAFAITHRVAWAVRAQGLGLVAKPYGEQCRGYKTDGLAFLHAGQLGVIDILVDAGGQNEPSWIVDFPTQNLAIRWAAPFDPGDPTPSPPAPPESSVDLTLVLREITALQTQLEVQVKLLQEQIARLQASEDAWHQVVSQTYHSWTRRIMDWVVKYAPAVLGGLLLAR